VTEEKRRCHWWGKEKEGRKGREDPNDDLRTEQTRTKEKSRTTNLSRGRKKPEKIPIRESNCGGKKKTGSGDYFKEKRAKRKRGKSTLRQETGINKRDQKVRMRKERNKRK